jgi:FkbM family methyltransferase
MAVRVPAFGARVTRRLRARFFSVAPYFTPYVATEVAGILFLVSTSDQAIGGRLFALGRRTEFDVLERLAEVLDAEGLGTRARRGVFLDVGANIGTAALTAVANHGFRAAIAVEPDAHNVALMQSNIALNGLQERVTTCGAALSSRPGDGWLVRSARNSGAHRLGHSGKGDGAKVEVNTVDHLLDDLGVEPADVGVLWIDVEGHEREVLEGASRLLTEAAPPVVVELSQRTAPLAELVTPHYARVVDLRTGATAPAAEIDRLVGGAAQSGRRTTDALLIPDGYPRGA